jgi:hypothetical protein
VLVAIDDELRARGHSLAAAAIDGEEVALAERAAAIGSREHVGVVVALGLRLVLGHGRYLRQHERFEIVADLDRVAGVLDRRQ